MPKVGLFASSIPTLEIVPAQYNDIGPIPFHFFAGTGL